MHLIELIQSLSRPSAFPDAPRDATVAIHQTHASVVFVVGDAAWKIKKPVNLGFLDFSTLERRRADCCIELELNRRMAPEIYRGLAAVVRDGSEVRVTREPRGNDQVVEWVVEMRRLPAEGMLDRLIPSGGVTAAMLSAFAAELARFHASANAGPEVAVHGAVEVLRRRIDGNLERLVAYGTRVPEGATRAALDRTFVERLATATREWLRRLVPTLERRRAEGRVRDGHGDLHARNLCVVEGRVIAYDCLEFEPAYRCADVAMDVAFLAMDLDRLGQTSLADAFVDAYIEASGDAGLAEPSRFFRLHYAIVRSMVESIRLHERETSAAEKSTIEETVRSYAHLAAGYLVEPATVILMGLPASGKSTLARALARALRAPVLSSDRLRKELHGVAPTERGDEAIYTDAASQATYRGLAERAAAVRGSVVIDASHRLAWQRAISCAAAAARGSRWLLVEVDAEPGVVRERLARRAQDPTNESDATVAFYERCRAERAPPIDVQEDRRLTVVSRDEPAWVDQALASAMTRLMTFA